MTGKKMVQLAGSRALAALMLAGCESAQDKAIDQAKKQAGKMRQSSKGEPNDCASEQAHNGCGCLVQIGVVRMLRA